MPTICFITPKRFLLPEQQHFSEQLQNNLISKKTYWKLLNYVHKASIHQIFHMVHLYLYRNFHT